MPFPIAHPAAVLPLRRYCRGRLNFPALVIGTLVPDAAYLFPNSEIGSLSHQLVGSLLFGLPAGLLMLATFYGLRKIAAEMLPSPRRQMILAFCQRPLGSLWLATLSLLIGIWSHVFWDSFTHSDGWITGHLPVLQTQLFQFAGRTAKFCHLLWYVSSFAGVGWLFVAFENWKWNSEPQPAGKRSSMIQDGILMAVLVVPVSLLHHLVRSPIVFVLTAVLCVLLVVIFFVKMTSSQRDTPL